MKTIKAVAVETSKSKLIRNSYIISGEEIKTIIIIVSLH